MSAAEQKTGVEGLPPKTLRALGPVRAAVGCARVAFPGTVIPGLAKGALGARGRGVVRVLGARQITQALLTGRDATRPVLWLGAEADLAHAASMIGLAIVGRRYRRDALAEATIAVAFALAGISAARAAPVEPARPSRLGEWRHRIAERLARRLVPGYGRCQPVERVCLSAPSGTTEPESTEPESTELSHR